MSEWLLTYVWTSLDYIGVTLLYDGFSDRRFKINIFWEIAIIYIFVTGTAFNAVDLHLVEISKILVSMLAYICFYVLQYKNAGIFGVLIAAICYAMLCCIDNLCYTGIIYVCGMEILWNDYANYLMPLVVRVVFVFVCFAQKKLRRTHDVVTANWHWYIVPAFLSFMVVVLTFFFGECFSIGQMTLRPLFVCALFLTLIQVSALFLVSWMEQNAHFREETLSLQTRTKAQQESMEALSAAYAQQRKLTHDFQAHLDMLENLLVREGEDAVETKRYLHDLRRAQVTRLLLVDTHNTALNALLNQKALLAKNRKIDIQFLVNDLSSLVITIVDLTVVISNTLDNAIESCEKLPEKDRQIQVQVLLEDDAVFFSVRNRSLPISLSSGQLPPSTKINPALHGYGLENVRSVLQKYGALYAMSYQDGWFKFATELPNTMLL